MADLGCDIYSIRHARINFAFWIKGLNWPLPELSGRDLWDVNFVLEVANVLLFVSNHNMLSCQISRLNASFSPEVILDMQANYLML